MRKYGWIAAAVIVLDQLSKAAAQSLGENRLALIPGVLGLRYAENTGMAFSLFSGRPWLLGILAAVLVAAGAAALRRYQLGRWSGVSTMLMLGGAVGNMIDRLLRGYVVDMLEVLCFRFAVFNIADAALTVGCALMAYSLIFRPDEWREKHHGDTEGNAA